MLKKSEDQSLSIPPAPPRHIAIIMDGNGRWAARRSLPRTAGHRKGVDVVRKIVQAAGEIGVEYLTLFSFSSENWTRPAEEVKALMMLLKRFIQRDLSELHKNNVRVRVIGARDNLDAEIVGLIEQSEEQTKDNTGLTLVVAFNYGAQAEIARAVQKLAENVRQGVIEPSDIEPEDIAANLDTKDIPNPDIVIRTSGEQRLSNFLLWQSAYAELIFTDTLWPDFNAETLQAAIDEYHSRERRFGGISAQASG